MIIKFDEEDVEDLEFFLYKRGQPTSTLSVSDRELEKWVGILPNRLLYFWQELGWCNFNNGLLWLVNPDEFAPAVEDWLKGTKYPEIDTFHCYARTAFGTLMLYGENCKRCIEIETQRHWIWADDRKLVRPQKNGDITIGVNLSGDDEDYDLKDVNRKGLFAQALKKLGALKSNEMYAFEPFLSLLPDEKKTIDYLVKVRMDVHLAILRELEDPISLGTSFSDIYKV